jgi:hypothetical protein
VFDRPMRSGNGCGTSGAPIGPAGSIDAVLVGSSVPYSSPDRAFDESIRSATRAMISADCTSVTLLFDRLAPAGTLTVNVSGVQDISGSAIDPARASATVAIRDEGRPEVLAVQSSGEVITVTFSEPMMELGEGGGVRLPGNYQLDGTVLSTTTTITCNDAGCRSVRIAVRAGSLVVGRTHSLRIANTVDRTGMNITPDPSTRTFVAG